MFSSVEKQQLKVPAHIDYLGDLRDFITEIGRKHRFSDKVVNAFKLSVDEAATNIIRHAYRDDDGLITLRAIVKKNSLTLSIIDQGMFFDPKRVQDPDLNRYVDIGKKGGLGIFIMRKLMDEIDYRKTEEGNELRITKYRDEPAEKKLFKSVSNIPFSIKAKFFFRAISIITVIITLGYLYFFLKTDDELISDFLTTSHATNRNIVNRISSAPAEDFTFVEDIVSPIEEEYKGRFTRISIEDSAGHVAYSSDLSEIFSQFTRPATAEVVDKSIFKYKSSDSEEVFYELESPIIIKQTGRLYGKSHIYFSANRIERDISSIRLDSLQLALLILGLSYAGVALLIYLVMNPFHKLSEWVKTLGQGEEIEDEVDLDASTEIGEIARAFSDIQSKFRDSQKNLADQERLQKEMQVAQEIQQTLLPMEFPELEGYQLSAYYEAAKEVGGDYYDFVEVDKDTLGVAVADVSGKGVPGSLVMTMIRTALRTEARGLKDAAEVLSRVNSFVSNDIKKGMFVTVFYLIIDSKKRSLNYASAGHNPMILYRGSTKQTYYLNPKGFPIGVQLPERDYFRKYIESDTIQLTKDDILLLYTDGITEAMNSNRDLYGEERLQKVLNDYGNLPVTDFVERLKDNIYSFTEGSPQYDDITLVAVKEESSREEDELRRAQQVHELVAAGKSVKDACEEVNITTYAYYNKYKKIFDEKGIDAFEIDESISVEAKHLSIEEKTKIFDIVQNYPGYGAARIREELNTEKYGLTELSESKIYDELVRSRLNTKALREAFINKAKRNKRRIKPPGTPFMTLDGKIIIKKEQQRQAESVRPEEGKEAGSETAARKDGMDPSQGSISAQERPPENDPADSDDSVVSEFEEESMLETPLEELFATPDETIKSDKENLDDVEPQMLSNEAIDSNSPDDFQHIEEETSLLEDFSFEELFEQGSQIDSDEGTDADSELVSDSESQDSEKGSDEDGDGVRFTAEADEILEGADFESSESLGQDDDNPVSSASVEELLQDSGETDEESGLQEQEPQDEDEDKPAFKEVELDDETVSFSDLIQAIDEEIVYVTQPEDQLEKELFDSESVLAGALDQDDEDQAESDSLETREPAVQNGDYEQSEGTDTSGETAGFDKEAILISGIKHYKNDEYDKAIEEFKKIIGIYPAYKEAHSILGNAYFRNKMYNEAAIEYQKVKEIDPDDITAYENMGVIYANRGEYRQAVGEWQKVIELSPGRTDIEEKIRKALRLI